MSLIKTLARVAGGVILAKGIGGMMKSASQGQTGHNKQTGGGILGDLFGQSQSRGASSGGGLGDLLGKVLGGDNNSSGGSTRYGGEHSPGAKGGLGGLLDSLTKSNIGSGAAMASPLATKDSQPKNDASFGELFNDSLRTKSEPEIVPTPEQNAVAGLMLRAMIQAAKSDGKIDEAEKERLMGEVGDLDDEERQFIRDQMAAPVDPEALAREVPKGLESQVYMMSVMAIDFDSEAEAMYLHKLAEALGLSRQDTNAIHEKIGVQNLYS